MSEEARRWMRVPACGVRSALAVVARLRRALGSDGLGSVVPVVARLMQLDTLRREGFRRSGSSAPVRWDGVMQ